MRAIAVVCGAWLLACSGTIDRSEPTPLDPLGGGGDGAGSRTGVSSGSGGAAAQGGAGNQPGDPLAPGAIDVGRIPLHRLNNTEYDNTVRDLLGVKATGAQDFIADEKLAGFDNIAEALGMTDAQYEQYFNAADALVESAFADAALRARIVTCTPSGSGSGASDTACTREIIGAFGKRAWRRPLSTAEVDRLSALAMQARTLGEDFDASIAHVAKALLSSVHFLYRVELDPDPSSTTAHPLNAYELASRLSYLLWSTMPDPELFQLAESKALLGDAALHEQLERLLDDKRAERFIAGFAGQWLGLRDLKSHQIEPTAFPDWDEGLRGAMIAETSRYFAQFLTGDRSMDEFFTADVNFVDERLAGLYDLSGNAFDPQKPTIDTRDARRGFLGLASFLTVASYSYRTAPTLRGKWVLENLLCQHIAPPPANVPKLDDSAEDSPETQSLNVRERLSEHRKNPQCAACHVILDPIGLGLENFDAIGRHRTAYANGDAVDASGMLPTGEPFNGLYELSSLLASDERLIDCASEKLLTYALSRRLGTADEPYLKQLRASWRDDGTSMRTLLTQIVLGAPFRNRHGEVP